MSELDREVAEALGYESVGEIDGRCWIGQQDGMDHWGYFSPSTDWSQGGKLIEEYKIDTQYVKELREWCAYYGDTINDCVYGETPLIAACKAIIASLTESNGE